jgi:cytochrome c peroxidase
MRTAWHLVFALFFVVACENKRQAAPAAGSASAPASSALSGGPTPTTGSSALPAFEPEKLNPFAPIPEGVEKPAIDDETKLGQMLYFDVRLSRGHDVSCMSCHDLARAGVDGAAQATGTKRQKGKRNTPTVLNAGGASAQGWDARATTIEQFVVMHVADAEIMGTDEKRLLATLESIPGYAAAFKKAYPDEKPAISTETFGRALSAYTTKLFARSRWDRYLAGDKSAVTDAELTGLAMFVEAGCTACHQGKYLGATQTQKLGIAKPWPPPAGTDPGRFEVTKQEVDRGMFKVPSLRNVTRTAPYMHDGSIASLEEVTRLMARHQVGKELSDPQVSAIVTFLGTLSGDPPKELVAKPQLPPSGPKTPKPE